MQLYTYWRSSAAYRVRIALNLKEIEYEPVYIHLVRDGGEQRQAEYSAVNPQQLVPALKTPEGTVLTQSMAIMEYLEEAYPAVPLLPAEPLARARVRALAQAVACDIHPLNNLRVLQYLGTQMAVPDAQKTAWYRHWIGEGFQALETLLATSPETGRFCHGDTPGMADACLVPQLYNARRFEVDLSPFPTLLRIERACNELAAFQRAHPDQQGDAA